MIGPASEVVARLTGPKSCGECGVSEVVALQPIHSEAGNPRARNPRGLVGRDPVLCRLSSAGRLLSRWMPG